MDNGESIQDVLKELSEKSLKRSGWMSPVQVNNLMDDLYQQKYQTDYWKNAFREACETIHSMCKVIESIGDDENKKEAKSLVDELKGSSDKGEKTGLLRKMITSLFDKKGGRND